eukprot:scaffold19645_cov51-Prasinocladus_malaysianus.AAC.1
MGDKAPNTPKHITPLHHNLRSIFLRFAASSLLDDYLRKPYGNSAHFYYIHHPGGCFADKHGTCFSASEQPQSRCIFTFVRNPITRFVSGYYEHHKRYEEELYSRAPATRRTDAVVGEPARFRQFVDDFLEFGHKLPDMSSGLHHVETQLDIINGALNYTQLDFVGRVETIKESIKAMKTCCQGKCVHVAERYVEQAKRNAMKTMINDLAGTMFHLEALGLADKLSLSDMKPDNASPALKAIDRITFDKIVTAMKDDFEVFGYSTNYCDYPEL